MKRFPAVLLLCGLLVGCAREEPKGASLAGLEPVVHVVTPQRRTITRHVAQPGFIRPYEETAVYAKVAGFVRKWDRDIGDRVKKDDVLAELLVPELVEEHKQKQAEVELDRVLVNQADKQVIVAERNLETAAGEVEEARALVKRYQAEVERWVEEVRRLTLLTQERIVDQQILDETQKQLKSSEAAREASNAAVKAKEAARLAADATVAKAQVDALAARARVKVAEAEERRLAALIAYTRITAPYDGIITARHVNTGDLVRPATGDPSVGRDPVGESASRATPLYVVARSDLVMFVIGVPEMDAAHVSMGTRATIRVPAMDNTEIPATVTRTSWALRNQSRTLQAEIDLPNPDAKLLPGMYAYGTIVVERSDVLAVPLTAVTQIGNQNCCYLLVNGKAVRTPVITGMSDGGWIEVLKKKTVPSSPGGNDWIPFTGQEQLIADGLSELANGQAVTVARGQP